MTAEEEPSGSASPALEGSECPRCAHALRPDWNFCPTCSLPSLPGKEVLSSQIQVLRTAGASRRRPTPAPIKWAAAVVTLALVVATGLVGFLVLSPQGTLMILPGNPVIGPTGPAAGGGEFHLDWALVPAGEFGFGPPLDAEHPFSETLYVPAFEILRTEVSNAQWREFLLDRREDLEARGLWESSVPGERSGWTWSPDPADPEGERLLPGFPWSEAGLPVREVSYVVAEEFCAWLRETGRAPGARMPREEEWEKAARGTDGRTYPWGEGFEEEVSILGRIVTNRRAVVGTATPTAVNFTTTDISHYRVLHMAGNVSEWTDHGTWKRKNEPGAWRRYRIIRGASFQEMAEDGAISARTWNADFSMESSLSTPLVGFRIARDAGAGAPPPSKGEEPPKEK